VGGGEVVPKGPVVSERGQTVGHIGANLTADLMHSCSSCTSQGRNHRDLSYQGRSQGGGSQRAVAREGKQSAILGLI
jgi:hypothetical protein